MSKLAVVLLVASFTFQLGCVRIPHSSASQSAQSRDSAMTQQYPNLKQQAIQLSEATIRGDWGMAEKLTYPKLVEEAGGSEGFRDLLAETLEEIQAAGLKVESISVGEPQDFLEFERRIYVIVPNTVRISGPRGLVVNDTFLIGISEDKGLNWTFVDADATEDKDWMRTLFPKVADKLRIPEKKRPVLHRHSQ